MSDAIGLKVFKTPGENQYVCIYGYHFVKNGKDIGRVLWAKPNELDGIMIDKDET